jgi:hypothetical protein
VESPDGAWWRLVEYKVSDAKAALYNVFYSEASQTCGIQGRRSPAVAGQPACRGLETDAGIRMTRRLGMSPGRRSL